MHRKRPVIDEHVQEVEVCNNNQFRETVVADSARLPFKKLDPSCKAVGRHFVGEGNCAG